MDSIKNLSVVLATQQERPKTEWGTFSSHALTHISDLPSDLKFYNLKNFTRITKGSQPLTPQSSIEAVRILARYLPKLETVTIVKMEDVFGSGIDVFGLPCTNRWEKEWAFAELLEMNFGRRYKETEAGERVVKEIKVKGKERFLSAMGEEVTKEGFIKDQVFGMRADELEGKTMWDMRSDRVEHLENAEPFPGKATGWLFAGHSPFEKM